MRTVTVELSTSASPDHAFEQSTNFECFPEHSAVIHEVTQTGEGATAESRWEVTFRQGRLRWTERDAREMEARRCTFTLLEGDFDVFEGMWEVTETPTGARILFTCGLDFGIPSMQGMLEPLAGRVLTESIHEVIQGLLPDVQVIHMQP